MKKETYLEKVKKQSFEKLKYIVSKKGGKCLSHNYINCETKLPFQCNEGHIWETIPSVIRRGSWCPICVINKRREKAMNNIIKIIKNKRGHLLTKEYPIDEQKLEIECHKKHIFFISCDSLLGGHWCSACVYLNKKLTKEKRIEGFNRVLKIVKKRNGKCLSELKDYDSVTSKLRLKCSENHEWEAMATSIKRGHWCPICNDNRKRNDIEDIIKFVESKGGKLLTKEYFNNKQKLEVECHKGHIWFVSYHALLRGCWCPDCKQSLSEKLFRLVLEKLFNCSFKSYWPEWLKGKKGHILQIDGYNKKLKMGFEHQGMQHFKFVPYFHKTIDKFKYNQQNDLIKSSILANRKIFMLYPTYKLKKENYLNFIEKRIKNTRYYKLANFNQNININKLYELL